MANCLGGCVGGGLGDCVGDWLGGCAAAMSDGDGKVAARWRLEN